MARKDIVVVGASAGGMGALERLVAGLPKDFPAAMFVVWHLSPGVRSVLPQVLKRAGPLPAAHPDDGDRIEPGRIYVAPNDHHLLLEKGYVRVAKGPKENRFRPAVDPLFRSAAYIYGPRVIGVVLTGALDDGTAGLWAIKLRGGTAIVQDPEDAMHRSMPLHALDNVEVDYTVPATEIGPLLGRLVREQAGEAPPALEPQLDLMQSEIKIAEGSDALAQPLVAALIADAEATKQHGALAAALLAAGQVERDADQLTAAREHLTRAAAEAGAAGDDELLVEALTYQAIVIGDAGRPLDALGVAEAAKAIAARGHIHAEKLGMVHGEALRDAGRLPEAIDELEQTVAQLEARKDPGARVLLAATLGGLASTYESNRNPTKAVELHHRTLAIEEADYGPDHPEVGKTLHDLANSEKRLGAFADAKAHYEQARAIFVAAYGPNHELVGETDISLAGLALDQNHDDDAERLFAQAQAELTTLPADHPVRSTIEEALGSIARDRDRCKDALPHFERALTISEHLGRTGPDLGGLLINLGACYADVGRDADAAPVLARAEKLYAEASVPEREYAELRVIEADLAARTGEKAHAIELAEKVLATTTDDDPNPAMAQIRTYAREQLASWRKTANR
jgi:tetratricopeptide (TPR) repeat protein